MGLRKLQAFIWDIERKNPSRISTIKTKTQNKMLAHCFNPRACAVKYNHLNIAFIYSFRYAKIHKCCFCLFNNDIIFQVHSIYKFYFVGRLSQTQARKQNRFSHPVVGKSV